MKTLRILSDTHCEFWKDGGASLLDPFPGGGILVLAGDITSEPAQAREILRRAADKYEFVIYVPGNHEFYQYGRDAIMRLRAMVRNVNLSNVALLYRDTVEAIGLTFAGCTLWYKDNPNNLPYLRGWGDAPIGYDFIYEESEKDVEFLNRKVQPGTIVVTHMLPHPYSIHPKYARSDTNGFFLNNVSELVSNHSGLWIHGHTHESMRYMVNGCLVVCNPLGYRGEVGKNGFDETLIGIEVE